MANGQRSYVSLTNTMTAPPAVGPWPGTNTQSNLDWEGEQQRQMKAAMEGLNTLVSQAEAAQFARQQESQQAQAQYLAAVNGPANMAPPMSMALPYAAAQFSSALSGRPEVGQQADQSLALNRSMQLQRRGQLLEQLSQQTQEAARRAEAAGDLTNALKFNTKANSYLKEIEQAGTGLREARKTAVDQQYDAWKTLSNQRAEYLQRLVTAGAGLGDPKLAARLFALKEKHDSEITALNKQIEMTPMKDRGPLMERYAASDNSYIHQTELVLAGGSSEPAPPAAATGTGAGPGEQGAANPTAEEFIRSRFGDLSLKEVIDALRTRDKSGKRMGDLIGKPFNLSHMDLQLAARRSLGTKRSLIPRPPYRTP